jgi:hypothetical protein
LGVLKPLEKILERVTRGREDSDVAYFFDLLYAGELVFKLATTGLLACMDDDRERHRYRLEFELVRADGLGTWSKALDDAIKGPARQALSHAARGVSRELTHELRTNGDEWQSQALTRLHAARTAIDAEADSLPGRAALRRWFAEFAALRNRTRGHGAPTLASCSSCCTPLHASVDLVIENLGLFQLPWVHVRRNISGKYRVTDLGNGTHPFDYLKASADHSLSDGVYLWLDEPRFVALCTADEDVRDFYVPNGGFTDRTYELFSYATDSTLTAESREYIIPPTALPPSETQGLGELDVVGKVFANLPQRVKTYVRRDVLEDELTRVLSDDTHPLVTLVGRGGIGKTSLALETLYKISSLDRFFAIVWFSARDIELLPQGPKLVQPHVLSPAEMANEYVQLMQPSERAERGFKALDYFARALADDGQGGTLFVFDNFETVRSPAELHQWLDTHIRLPNKVLVTTRSRDFKSDYWVEVGGMTEGEFAELVNATADELAVAALVDDGYLNELYREADGHPYIAKVLLGELARSGKKQTVARIMASQDQVLEALFERTFGELTPAAQRIFITLSSWRSLVPLVALDAAISRPENERIDTEAAVGELRRSSLIETTGEGADQYLSVPLSASLFGRRKLGASPWKYAIEADTEVLQLFGSVQASGAAHGFEAQVERLFRSVVDKLQKRPSALERYLPVLEFVSRAEPRGWILLAKMYEELQVPDTWMDDAAGAYRRYLEVAPEHNQTWLAVARLSKQKGDYLGAAHALIERARLPNAPFADVSYATNQINGYLGGMLDLDTDERRLLLTSLVEVMEKRRAEADATDLSGLAWLLIKLKQIPRAQQMIKAGLQLDPANPHILSLATKFDVAV